MSANIKKLYISHILTGLVFWYGIEKLFMGSIGISPTGIGVATAVYLAFNLLFDVPAGMLADRWSRKGVLVISTLSLIACSLTLGTSHGLPQYLLGYLFYGCYMVTTNGVYQALIYDCLHEEGRGDTYSRVMGRAYALFLVGGGLSDICSGFLAHRLGYPFTFFVTIVPCTLNAVILMSIKEPHFHMTEQREKIWSSFAVSARELIRVHLLRALAIVWSILFIVEIFKQDFGQVYMLRYVTAPQAIGLLWAAYAFTWALGSFVAHYFKKHLSWLIALSVLPLLVMSFVDSRVSLVLFMVQAVAAAAMYNLIETRVQEATPSRVRASILSLLATSGRTVAVPASFGIGYLIAHYNAFVALRGVTIIAVAVLAYWFAANRRFETLARAKQEIAADQ